MRLYLSMSVDPKDESQVEALRLLGPRFGIEPHVGRRPWDSSGVMPEDVASAIDSADLALFWLMGGGPHLHYANLEFGYIRNTRQRFPLLIVVDDHLQMSGFLQQQDPIRLNLSHPGTAIEKVFHTLRARNLEEPVRRLVGGFITAGIGAALMQSSVAAARAAGPAA